MTYDETYLKNENNLKNEANLKNDANLKYEDDLKKRLHQKSPLPSYDNITFFFWWPFTLSATPELRWNRKCYQVSKQEIDFHMINIIQAELRMRKKEKQKRQHFDLNTTGAKLYMYKEVSTGI